VVLDAGGSLPQWHTRCSFDSRLEDGGGGAGCDCGKEVLTVRPPPDAGATDDHLRITPAGKSVWRTAGHDPAKTLIVDARGAYHQGDTPTTPTIEATGRKTQTGSSVEDSRPGCLD